MLGWHISVYRQTNGGHAPATFISEEGATLAVWQTGLSGLNWINELVKKGNATALGGNGYPIRYTALSEYLVSRIMPEPPHAKASWTYGPGDVTTEKWAGKTVIDHSVASQCRPDEWLLIEAWDES